MWLCCAFLWAQEAADVQTKQDTLKPLSAADSVLHVSREKALIDSLQAVNDSLLEKALNDSRLHSALNDSVAGLVMDSVQMKGAIDSLMQTVLHKDKVFTPDPLRSLWLAMILPGGGQVYNHKYWKLPIVYGGVLGCVYALSWNGQMLRDYSQAYLDIMDDDPNTKSYEKMLPLGYDITGREDRFKDIFKRKKNYYRKYRDMSIFAFAGVYLISVIDAYVDAELSSFDISRELGLKWEPSKMNEDNMLAQRLGMQTYGIRCSLTF